MKSLIQVRHKHDAILITKYRWKVQFKGFILSFMFILDGLVGMMSLGLLVSSFTISFSRWEAKRKIMRLKK